MSLIPNDGRMKPIIIVPPETISDADIKELRDNGLCVVVAKDPAAVKFLDPILSVGSRTVIEDAAIALSRKLLNRDMQYNYDRKDICRLFVDLLVKGTSLDAAVPTVAEKPKGKK